jgi:hypothetical protein
MAKSTISQQQKDIALDLYIQRKSLAQIHEITGIPLRSLYNLKHKYDWDSYLRIGNIELAKKAEEEFFKEINKAIEQDRLGDPGTVDKLTKLGKVLERLLPKRQLLNNIYSILEAQTDYINRLGNPELAQLWQKHLAPLAEHLRLTFAGKD